MEILRTLGDTSDPLSFSELHGRVGMRNSGQFYYHLDKLVGHFVEDTGDGYQLQRGASVSSSRSYRGRSSSRPRWA